jgi:hypothetical protein
MRERGYKRVHIESDPGADPTFPIEDDDPEPGRPSVLGRDGALSALPSHNFVSRIRYDACVYLSKMRNQRQGHIASPICVELQLRACEL